MQLELIASEPHYRDHLLPIWRKLPEELRGKLHELRPHVRPPAKGNIALIAGWQDLALLPDETKCFYVEHGAGQTYPGDPKAAWLPGYSAGSRVHRGVVGYICPSQTVADRHGSRPSVAVGCPKMDPWMPSDDLPVMDTACFVFHWDARNVCPEARTAFWHYSPHLAEIAARWTSSGWRVTAHLHPRWRGALDETLTNMGIEILKSDTDVFAQASILFCDNSSLAYEFASLGRTVVSLNAPWYRRDVEHGLRFWEYLPGPWVDWPFELLAADPMLWIRTDEVESRLRAVEHVYAFTDGRASERAAEFIVQRMSEL